MVERNGVADAALRVMIVEDDTLVGMGLESQIQRLGHRLVGRATDAAEATRLFKDQQPDLVLMDIRLDDTDGLELAERLIGIRRVPMIVVSAYSDTALIRRATDIGVFGYLIKPITLESLAAQIEVASKRFEENQRLVEEKDALARALESRKLIERAKGILMKRLNLSEAEAHRRLQQESQKRRISIADLAKKIVDSEELLGGL